MDEHSRVSEITTQTHSVSHWTAGHLPYGGRAFNNHKGKARFCGVFLRLLEKMKFHRNCFYSHRLSITRPAVLLGSLENSSTPLCIVATQTLPKTVMGSRCEEYRQLSRSFIHTQWRQFCLCQGESIWFREESESDLSERLWNWLYPDEILKNDPSIFFSKK